MPAPQPTLEMYMLGVAAGDALGLPYEGLSRTRVQAFLQNRQLNHRLIVGRGMVSDDTEHMLLTADAWARSGGDAGLFAKRLARNLRLWFLALPPATGLATAKACVRLLLGVPPHRSGVRSAGNGPAMRAGILGLLCETDADLVELTKAATLITHTDPRAVDGSIAVALAARIASSNDDPDMLAERYKDAVARALPQGEMRVAVESAINASRSEIPIETYTESIGCANGVSGYIMHTVPACVFMWLREPLDVERAIEATIRLGGDTDSTAAIIGGLVAANPQAKPIPKRWLDDIMDIPINTGSLRRAAKAIAINTPPPSAGISSLTRIPRNLALLIIALAHGFRRALPPYASR